MAVAQPPDDWQREDLASTLLEILSELVEEIANPRWRSSCKAALRMPVGEYAGAECDSVTGRWRALARREGIADNAVDEAVERYRGYWTVAAVKLAEMLATRIAELNRNGGWDAYRPKEPHAPVSNLPISFDRTDALFHFDKQRGTGFTSYRWLTAHGPVDHYETVGWYYSDPDAQVNIIPLANCSLDGPLRELPKGGQFARLAFGKKLNSGDKHFFAYSTTFVSDRSCRPYISYEVRGMSMGQLTIRAQFDVDAIPVRCWHFDVSEQIQGSTIPDDGAPELLEIGMNGYVEHSFHHCKPGREYGLRWIWAATPTAAADEHD